jgi:cytochrome c peroxidase
MARKNGAGKRHPAHGWAAACALALLAGCGGGGSEDSGASTSDGTAALSDVAALGKRIFFDASLSASGRMSCATCHDPAFAHAQPNASPVQPGGAQLDMPGFRAVPSLRYLRTTPAFFFDAEGTPAGGFNRDGRANTLADQARRPFLAPHEMANGTADAVAQKLAVAAYAEEFRRVFGANVFAEAETAFDRARFAPFDSKYDLFLAGRVRLSGAELRGLALFNDPQKGNCAACHPSGRGADGSPPLFTDFTYDNLGVPRNAQIPATRDPAYYDLGLCGPDRTDLATRAELCGAFKVPTLRNVATRKVFFHNGRFDSLITALQFYVQRDTDPAKWYPQLADGSIDRFDDLPAAYKGNVNQTEVPYNRKLGDAPALTDAEIADLAAFLGTLTDGYRP